MSIATKRRQKYGLVIVNRDDGTIRRIMTGKSTKREAVQTSRGFNRINEFGPLRMKVVPWSEY